MFITKKKLEALQEESYVEGATVRNEVVKELIEEARADGYNKGKADGIEQAKSAFKKTIDKLAKQKTKGE